MVNYIINRWYFQKTVKTILVPETLLPLEIVSEFCTPYLQKKKLAFQYRLVLVVCQENF